MFIPKDIVEYIIDFNIEKNRDYWKNKFNETIQFIKHNVRSYIDDKSMFHNIFFPINHTILTNCEKFYFCFHYFPFPYIGEKYIFCDSNVYIFDNGKCYLKKKKHTILPYYTEITYSLVG